MKLQGRFLLAVFSLAYMHLVKGQSFPGCKTSCDNVTIEYPFGTSPGCYYAEDPSFNITCNERDELIFGDNKVLNISHSGKLRVKFNVSYICYNSQRNLSDDDGLYYTYTLANLSLSSNNKFTLVGCNAYALLTTFGSQGYSTGCMSLCNSLPTQNRNCYGQGCCTTDVSMPLDKFKFRTRSFRFAKMTSVYKFNRCTYAFLVEDGKFNFSSTEDLWDLRSVTDFPVVLDWSIGKQTCEQVVRSSRYICGKNSECFNSTRGIGYNCKCTQGFEGNPYLETGCKDIDECNVKTTINNRHNCSSSSTCLNTPGSSLYVQTWLRLKYH